MGLSLHANVSYVKNTQHAREFRMTPVIRFDDYGLLFWASNFS
jgi:hypothetical protein